MTLEPTEKFENTTETLQELVKEGYLIDTKNHELFEKYLNKLKNNKKPEISKKHWEGKRVLITGISGMVGSTIADELIDAGAILFGIVRRHAIAYHPYIQKHMNSGKLKTFEVDLRDYNMTSNVINEVQPHAIFHQAAESFVPTSIDQPAHVTENNCVSTVNILEATKRYAKEIEGVQLACSSEQYGFIDNVDEVPVKETHELRPTSTYAATKVFTDYIGRSYYFMYRVPTVITRTFNQEGPRRGLQFFTAVVASQIAECLNNKKTELIIGNPNSVRDMTHVHESAVAQIMAIEKCNKGEPYNICSGVGIRMGDYARLAIKTNGLEEKVKLMTDTSRIRPYERGNVLFDGFIGDNTKFVEKTGWQPTKSILDIIKDGVEFYKNIKL
ncbi:MAG: GDP-mannose 4,6-dehydratase [Candidatus Micrarchaeota archaeon]